MRKDNVTLWRQLTSSTVLLTLNGSRSGKHRLMNWPWTLIIPDNSTMKKSMQLSQFVHLRRSIHFLQQTKSFDKINQTTIPKTIKTLKINFKSQHVYKINYLGIWFVYRDHLCRGVHRVRTWFRFLNRFLEWVGQNKCPILQSFQHLPRHAVLCYPLARPYIYKTYLENRTMV